MAKERLTWRRLLPGLLILVALAALTAMVLFRARVGAVRGDTYRLYALSNEARGVLKGTEVWLDGKKVGLVDDIRFRAATTDTSERILLVLSVLEEMQPLIRENSRVSIRSGGRLISSPVIFITSGTEDAPMLARRDTLHPGRQSDLETLTSDFALAARQAAPVIRDIRQLSGMLSRSRDRMKAVRTDAGEPAVQAVGRDVKRLSRRAERGGTFSAMINDDSLLFDRAGRVMTRVDSVLELAQRPSGTLGGIARDSALVRTLKSMRDELSIVRARMRSAEGTMGRLGQDSALTWQMMRRERALEDLMADIKKNPSRYLSF
jgi:ABC-type transporter Mla subunit MlaD